MPAPTPVAAAAPPRQDAAKAPVSAPEQAAAPAAQPAPQPAQPPSGAQPGEGLRPTAVAAPPPTFYVQLTATRSEDAARSLAARYETHGAQAIPPRPGTGDDNWRVWAGPYKSREAADSAGRVIGIAYWIVDKSRDPRP